MAYCPERYNPSLLLGDKIPKIIYNDKSTGIKNLTLNEIAKVVGGVDKKSRVLTKAIYSKIIQAEIIEVSSIEAAEATKLIENIFRDVNIALVNELAKVYSKFGLNIFEIIDAAKTKPFAFLPHYPGAGVGGECYNIASGTSISINHIADLMLDISNKNLEIKKSPPKKGDIPIVKLIYN